MRLAIALIACVAAFTLTGCFEGPKGDKGDKGDTGDDWTCWTCRTSRCSGISGKELFDPHQSGEWHLPGS